MLFFIQKCDVCIDSNKPCDQCGDYIVFRGPDALDQFCKWLFRHTKCVAIAHNSKGFDGQFILQWIHKQGRKPTICRRDLEILCLEYSGVKLLDSMCFIPMALSQFPKCLGFVGGKGYFPHLFNRMENWNVIQEGLPDQR